MVIGTTLMKLDGQPYYSPQFNRGGNGAQFTLQVLNISTNGELVVEVEHKNADDITWSVLATFSNATIVSIITVAGNSIKEELRFKYSLNLSTAEWDSVHFLMLAPTWRPY